MVYRFVVGGYTEGAAYAYSGTTGNELPNCVEQVLPDVNGDGLTEIVVSAPRNNAGSAYIYSGSTR